jgi:hypothetical protein
VTRRACVALAGIVVASQALIGAGIVLAVPHVDASVWGLAIVGCVPVVIAVLRVAGGTAFQRAPIIGPTVGVFCSLCVALFVSAAAAHGMLPALSQVPAFLAAAAGIAVLYFGSLAGAVLQAGRPDGREG